MMKASWSTPSIVIEDTDQSKVTRLDFRRPLASSPAPLHSPQKPDVSSFKPSPPAIAIHPPTPTSPARSLPGAIIQPEVEAYVTPLSLCSGRQESQVDQQQRSPSSGKEKVAAVAESTVGVVTGKASVVGNNNIHRSESESSFTSVDIHGASNGGCGGIGMVSGGGESSWNSWNDSDASVQTGEVGCCFEFKAGLKTVGRAVASCAAISSSAPNRPNHTQVDMSDVVFPVLPHPGRQTTAAKKGMSKCSIVGVIFLTLAVLGMIAVGIAMYIEFVTKPLAYQKPPVVLNRTTLCDYLINGCDDGSGNGTSALNLNQTRSVQNETGKIEAQFSSNFTSKLTQLVQQKQR